MRISEAKEAIKELYKNTNSVTALISERGIGKTSAYRQCCNELGIGYIDLYAAALEGPDFMGLPDKDREKGITRYLAPQFLPTVEAVEDGLYPEKGILVLEEINRVSSDTTSVLYPLLLDRKINGHTLANGWKLGVTMNPDNMNYLVNTLDDAMIDRFISISIDADINDYIEYSKCHNGNSDVLDYLQAYPDMLLIVKKDSSPLLKSPTPRGWTKVQEILNNCSLNKELALEIIAGVVGPTAASSFWGYLESNRVEIPSTNELLEDYSKVSNAVTSLIDSNRFDILSSIITSLIAKLKNIDKEVAQVNMFLNELPQELQILFYKELSLKNGELLAEISDYLDTFNSVSDKIIDLMIG